ncbi:DNA polymerase III subunits gamma and tau [Caballeronia cordobensis]|uniref:DNA polymerase III subunit gamma/tau n=1 Tax=Caballeronia cordobensis TaxID=1353886 RepID=A0A158JD94_CABCO|nr:DNA polymerase III subunit gamma/tau [Caballeronia cordobensis]SAL66824.1 DNA polymerase III subunits gamma and tau [Caballeronia cordobensis]
MTYQVLARKWRPKSFESLVGQEHVVRALTHALDGGRLHHAYLFTGTRGVGKTTLSRIFAKALNCETGVTSKPCGVCRACREIDEGRFVDYVEMDAASNRGVDEMAALLERAVYAPVDARFKVYMIDEVHMLTNHAFNAMLKTLEEPPPHVKFILATTDPQKIPVTVLSRCLQFNLKQMPAGHIVSHLENILQEEQITFESQALRLLSRAADGSMRDALSLTDQAIAYSANQVTEEAVRGMLGALDQSYLIRLVDALAASDGALVLAIADEMALRSLSFSTALQDLASLLHRIAWGQFAPSSVLDEWPEATDIRRFADTLSAEQVQLFYQIATVGRSELGLAPDEYAGFTMTLLRMLAFEPAGGPGGGGIAVSAPSAAKPVARSAALAGAMAERAVAPAPVAKAPSVESVVVKAETAPPAEIAVAPAEAIESIESIEPKAIEPVPAKPAPVPEAVRQAVEEAAPAAASRAPEPEAAASRAGGGASAALEVLRSAGMRLSSDRGARGASTAPAAAPTAPKPAAKPAVQVQVPTPKRAATAPERKAAASEANKARVVPPWEDMPPDDYPPAGSADEYFMPPDDGFVPAFDSGPDDMRFNAEPAAKPAPVIDMTPLPPAVPLDALGVSVEWPALAVDLPLKGVAHQLAFNSELTACDASSVTLAVAVQMYTDASHVAKLKAALADKLGRAIEVNVNVAPARRTAAALDAADRARRQQEAEQEIRQDPFVQSLIRDFGASIVQGSIKPIAASGASPS